MTEPPPQHIAHDKRREAVASLRGYSYQVLRSIEVWTQLGDNEGLVLEGAEDLDRVSAGHAIVEQVKDTAGSGSITLRTGAVLDAIGHAWVHATNNRELAISFRYLTTSPIGREVGDPLGLGMPGLQAWQAVRADPASPSSLAKALAIGTFLAAQSSLERSLVAFLYDATAEQIVAQVIVPIDFIAGEGDIGALRQRIERRLVDIGSSRGDSVHDSLQSLGALHLEAWKRATDKQRRPLTWADFLCVFEGSTRTSLPNSQIVALISAALGDYSHGSVVVGAAPVVLERVPPLPPRYHYRAILEGELTAKLRVESVALQGGTGMGKTSLVAAIVSGLPNVAWLSLRDASPSLIRARLSAASAALTGGRSPPVVVLDDLEPGPDARLIEPQVADLAATVTALAGMIVVTGCQDLPPRLAIALGISISRILRVPRFDRAEIEAYLGDQGCPAGPAVPWAAIIEAGTSGHPQLVHARVNALRVSDFPRPTEADLISTPQVVLDARAEARRLVALLPPDRRELLLRASLGTGRLTRDHLIRIGRIEPEIEEPGAVLDELVGPWLEIADYGEFRVSPLVRDAAPVTRGIDWTRDMHLKLAWALLESRIINPSTLFDILLHITVARCAGPLVVLIPGLLGADEKVWEQIAEVCSLYTLIGTGSAQGTLFDNPADTMVFRLLQLRIAAQKGDHVLDDIILKADWEWTSTPRGHREDFFRFLFLSQLLSKAYEHLTLDRAIAYGLEFARLGKAMTSSELGQPSRAGRRLAREGASTDFWSFMALPVSKNSHRLEEFKHLLDLADGLPKYEARLVLQAYGNEPVGAGLHTDRLWLHETTSGRKDWIGLSGQLNRALAKAVELGVPRLAEAIARLLVRIADEDMGNAAGAISIGEVLRSRIERTAALDCAIAKVKWRAGDLRAALEMYADALPRWSSGRENLDLEAAYRDAGMAAAKAGDWQLAANRFAAGYRLLPEGRMIARRIGLVFDEGHALFMAGDFDAAMGAFTRGVDELVPLEPISDSEPVLSTQKRAGALLQSVVELREGKRSRDELEMYAGISSVVDPIIWDEMRPTPTDFIVYNLLRVEQLTTAATVAASRYAARIRATPYVVLQAAATEHLIRAMAADQDFSPLVRDLVVQARSLAVGLRQHTSGSDDFNVRIRAFSDHAGS